MRILFVCGRYDAQGGRPSGYMAQIARALDGRIETMNGGTLAQLDALLSTAQTREYDALWWMPDIDNTVPKFVGNLKDRFPRCVLVISKNNADGRYQPIDLVGRMLAARANLSLIIDSRAPFTASLFDPLGNAFFQREATPERVAQGLYALTAALTRFTRMGSQQVGDAIPAPMSPEIARFLATVRGYAETFHTLVHAANPSRFLGNASFRCTKAGFPAFRHEGLIYVSRRNLDKRELAVDGFVAVEAAPGPAIRYHGDAKPSVDAPIQRALFLALPWVNFMLHAHVYIAGAPFTDTLVPCGALEEVPEVLALADGREAPLFVNLTGHGCLALASTPDALEGLPFQARPIPELHEPR